jgi:cytochrome c2
MAPVQRWDWQKWSHELTDVSWQIYQAALDKDREKVSDLTNNLAEACDNCHRVYRSNAQGPHLRCLGSGIILPPQ